MRGRDALAYSAGACIGPTSIPHTHIRTYIHTNILGHTYMFTCIHPYKINDFQHQHVNHRALTAEVVIELGCPVYHPQFSEHAHRHDSISTLQRIVYVRCARSQRREVALCTQHTQYRSTRKHHVTDHRPNCQRTVLAGTPYTQLSPFWPAAARPTAIHQPERSCLRAA